MKDFLISKNELEDMKEWGIEPDRRTGRSTAIALRTIAEALANPGSKIDIIDHYDSREAHKHLAQTIADIVRTLRLYGIKITKTPRHYYPTIEFTLYEK